VKKGPRPPARLLVEIDEELKRELKVRLLREGLTLKDWIARSAQEYLGVAVRRFRPVPLSPVPMEAPHPQLGQVPPHLSPIPASLPALPAETEPEPERRYVPFRPDDDYLD